MSSRPRGRVVISLASVVLAAAFAGLAVSGWTFDGAAVPRPDTWVRVSGRPVGYPVPRGFVGVSVEYDALGAYAGHDPSRLNPLFVTLLRALSPGGRPVLRIGGDSSDTTWWPTPGVRKGGEAFGLTSRWLGLVRALARAIGGRLILGINLESGQPALGRAEARAVLAGVGREWIRALELGNEAVRYARFPWYHTALGHPVFARPRGYGFGKFQADFAALARVMPRGITLAGPTLGSGEWIRHLRGFLINDPRVGMVTYHVYPLNRCFTPRSSPTYPTLERLLARPSSRGISGPVRGYVATARAQHLPLRVDELNSVACGGKNGVSNTFAAALWALDTLFAMARAGVSGVNLHTFPGASYELFKFRRRRGEWAWVRAAPELYGMVLFAHAAPAGSRLLETMTRGSASVRAWATRAPDGGIRVTLINADLHHRHVVWVDVPTGRRVTLVRLTAPAANATKGIRLGGRTLASGELGWLDDLGRVNPRPFTASSHEVPLAPASAALLTVTS